MSYFDSFGVEDIYQNKLENIFVIKTSHEIYLEYRI